MTEPRIQISYSSVETKPRKVFEVAYGTGVFDVLYYRSNPPHYDVRNWGAVYYENGLHRYFTVSIGDWEEYASITDEQLKAYFAQKFIDHITSRGILN